MKKLFKVLLILAALGIVLVIAGTVALRIFLPPEKAKALVIKHLSEQLKREVQIGSVWVGLVSGLQMTGLKISEKPTFAKGTFISSEQLGLKVAILPLFSKKIIIRHVLLKKPDVTIIRMADGKTFNFSDLTETAEPAKPETKTTSDGSSFSLLVSQAEIADGALHFIDKSPAKQSADITPFDLKLQNVSLVKPFTLQMSTRVKYQGTDIGIVFGGEANLFSGTFDITKGEISTGQAKISIQGKVTELKTDKPNIRLHLESNAVPVKDLLKLAPPNAVPPGVVLDGTTKLSVDVSGTADQQKFAVKWTGTDMRVAQGQDFEKPVGVPLELSVAGDRLPSGAVQLKTIAGKISESQLNGNGTYTPKGDSAIIQIRILGNRWSLADLAKLSPTVAPYKPTGDLTFDMLATGPTANPVIRLNTQAKVLLATIKHPNYEGKELSLDWNLTDITPDLSKISGTANLKQGVGKIMQVEELARSSKIGKVALAPIEALAKLQKKGMLKQVNLPSLDTIPFDSLEGIYALKSGMMDIKKFDLLGKDLNIHNTGRVGLAGVQPIQMNVLMKLAVDSIGGTLGALMKDESGRPVVKFTVSGTVADAKVKWDTQDLQKKAMDQVGDELMKNKDIKGAVEEGEKLLKGIFR